MVTAVDSVPTFIKGEGNEKGGSNGRKVHRGLDEDCLNFYSFLFGN
jgi:hypothetical protein